MIVELTLILLFVVDVAMIVHVVVMIMFILCIDRDNF